MRTQRMHLTQRVRVVYKGLLMENAGMTAIEPYLYTKKVKDMAPSLHVFAEKTESVREMARPSGPYPSYKREPKRH